MVSSFYLQSFWETLEGLNFCEYVDPNNNKRLNFIWNAVQGIFLSNKFHQTRNSSKARFKRKSFLKALQIISSKLVCKFLVTETIRFCELKTVRNYTFKLVSLRIVYYWYKKRWFGIEGNICWRSSKEILILIIFSNMEICWEIFCWEGRHHQACKLMKHRYFCHSPKSDRSSTPFNSKLLLYRFMNITRTYFRFVCIACSKWKEWKSE